MKDFSIFPILLAAAWGVLFLLADVAAGEDAELNPDVSRLVAALSDPNYAQREAATEELARRGVDAWRVVLGAALGDDPEASQRASGILTKYADTFDAAVVGPMRERLERRVAEAPESPEGRRAERLLELATGDEARQRSITYLSNLGVSFREKDKKSVTRLWLGEEWMGEDHDLRHLQRFPELTWLDFSDSEVGDAALEPLAHLPNLEQLYLGRSAVCGEGLVHLQGLDHLEYLSLEGLSIENETVSLLAGLTGLQHLGLDYTKVTDEALSHLVDLKHLQTLWLNGTEVVGPGLKYLEQLPELKKLILANVQFGESGISHLSGLSGLEQLGLDGTNATDEEIVHLESLKKLRRLWLNETGVSDRCIASLAELEGLGKLEIPGCRFSEEGLTILREFLPDCEIETE